mmetsp:Transcript_38644/g.124155  ORF Transcript_38644/g.124155 Transcript_38644/m.124155 type:complete len:206 (+) Transcript_38644:47-664(+)
MPWCTWGCGFRGHCGHDGGVLRDAREVGGGLRLRLLGGRSCALCGEIPLASWSGALHRRCHHGGPSGSHISLDRGAERLEVSQDRPERGGHHVDQWLARGHRIRIVLEIAMCLGDSRKAWHRGVPKHRSLGHDHDIHSHGHDIGGRLLDGARHDGAASHRARAPRYRPRIAACALVEGLAAQRPLVGRQQLIARGPAISRPVWQR